MKESKLQNCLENGQFAVTAEIAPPKGIDFNKETEIAKELYQFVDAINVTDFQSANVKASSLGMCIDLIQNGIEPILQITGRDRNRIAIQGELLSAAHFGIENILCLTGDHPSAGDNSDAKGVFELDAVSILETATQLMDGKDLGDNPLQPPKPNYFLGATASPVYSPIELQLIQINKKAKAGAKFFQTQPVFSVDIAKEFQNLTKNVNSYFLYGIIPIKSSGMARFMNKNIAGIEIPNNLIELFEKSSDPSKLGMDIAADIIKQLKADKICSGVHIMAIGAEKNIINILKKAELIEQ